MKIGQVALKTGLNVQSIRFYERKGLLPSPSRTDAGQRLYDQESIQRIQFIKHAQAVGFSLNEISELLSLKVSPDGSCISIRQLAAEKLQQLEQRLEDIKRMKSALQSMMELCDEGLSVGDCPILEALDNNT